MASTIGTALLVALSIVLSARAAAQPFGDDPLVLVRRVVPARYFGTEGMEALPAALDQRLLRTTTLEPGQSLSGLISDQYSVGVSNAPGAYEAILERITELNSIKDTRRVAASTPLLVPDIPPIAKEMFNASKPANSIPKLSIVSNRADAELGKTFDLTLNAATKRPRITDTGRVGAAAVEQYRWLPLSEANKVLADATPEVPVSLVDVPWLVSFVDSEADGKPPPPLFSEKDADALRTLLARPPHQRPLLLILDDSWPSAEEFRRSKQFFVESLPLVRDTPRWKLGPPSFSSAFRQASDTTFPKDPNESSKEAHLHSRDILDSLEAVRDLEPSGSRVDVVFVPLFRAQMHAEELLVELIHFQQLVSLPGSTLADGIFPDQIAAKRKVATEVVSRISAELESSLLYSNQTLVEAVMWFAREFSEQSRRPVFLSFSWTTKRDDLHVDPPPDLYGFPVVAAGNEPAKDWKNGQCNPQSQFTAYRFKRQLVSRSKFPGDVIAVMNVAADGGPDCDSSLLEVGSSILALAFPGRLTGTTCGTSFATPRVAWFFAAKEAFRDYPADVANWKIATRDSLKDMREDSACAFNRIRFDPVRFLSNN